MTETVQHPVKDSVVPPSVTHVLMVVDMSGSMADLTTDVRGGFNAYLDQLATDGNNYRLTVTVFDTEFIPLAVDAPLAEVPRLDEHNYMTRGGYTALYDAIGKTLGEFQSKHGTVGPDERAMMVVQTDGFENRSREFRKHQIRKSIEDREATGRWMFVYLGAGPNAWAEGADIGMGRFSMSTTQSRAGTWARYSGLATASTVYAQGASVGETYAVIENTPGVADDVKPEDQEDPEG